MWSRLRLDVGWIDLASGLVAVGRVDDGDRDDAIVCLSVRSAFDLALTALSYPPGSEVLMSAVTIPHMPAIVREHGLVPVPLDIDPRTMAPTPEAFERAMTPRTRMLVVAHLLGGRAPMGTLGALARRRGLFVVEDCAQAFDGTGCSIDDEADLALYSFGTIKTATALGGAVARVRDGELLSAMRAVQAGYPPQSSGEHRRKLCKAGVLKAASTRPVYGTFVKMVARRGDLDERLHAAIAGFGDDRLFERLRRRPSPSLRRLLRRRLAHVDEARVARRARVGARLAVELAQPFEVAGSSVTGSSHWVVPVLVPDPDRVVRELRRRGFDATRWSSMVAIPAPPGHPCGVPVRARALLERAVFVPCYPQLSDRAQRRLCGALAAMAEHEQRAGTAVGPGRTVIVPTADPASDPIGLPADH